MTGGESLPARLRDGGAGDRFRHMASSKGRVPAVGEHLALGREAVGVLQRGINAERAEQVLPARQVERMRRARAAGADPQDVERHVEGDEAVLWDIKRRLTRHTARGKGSER